MSARRLQQSIHWSVEPGVLNVFRVFTLVEWGLLSLGFLSLLNRPPRWPDAYATMLWALYTFTLLYLSWPWLARILGRAYLPLALIAVSVAPVWRRRPMRCCTWRRGRVARAPRPIPGGSTSGSCCRCCSSARSMACALCCSSPVGRRCWKSRWRVSLSALAGRRSHAPRRTPDCASSSTPSQDWPSSRSRRRNGVFPPRAGAATGRTPGAAARALRQRAGAARHQPRAQPHRPRTARHAGAHAERGERPVEGSRGAVG